MIIGKGLASVWPLAPEEMGVLRTSRLHVGCKADACEQERRAGHRLGEACLEQMDGLVVSTISVCL